MHNDRSTSAPGTEQLHTPVVMLVYKRPDLAAQVLNVVRTIRPTKLYVVADGPQSAAESAACQQTRALFAAPNIDWPCQVHRDYSETNLGLKRRIPSGLNTVFTHEQQAIILEDDCLPDPGFFLFCQEMLGCYREDKRVGTITGTNFFESHHIHDADYFFSRIQNVWGWATWQDRWELYDPNLKLWPQVSTGPQLEYLTGNRTAARHRRQEIAALQHGRVSSWAYQLNIAGLTHSMLCLVPAQNMITNLGFGHNATNTHAKHADFASLPRQSGPTNFNPPQSVAPDATYDLKYTAMIGKQRTIHKRALAALRHFFQ
ncbi:MAG: glycosyltransferase family 2 protein [Planctomycetaceae bacterium]